MNRVRYHVECLECEKDFIINIPQDELEEWLNGKLIQEALKSLSINERELLLSHLCGNCFDKITLED